MYMASKPFLHILNFHLLTGRILNRFSKDVGFLDDLLPYIFCEFILVMIIIIFKNLSMKFFSPVLL